MHIIIDKEKLDGNFSVQLRLEGAETEEFKEAVKRNGFPKAELGGTFTEIITTSVTDEETGDVTTEEKEVEVFKLVSKVIDIPTSLPYTRVFKATQYGENAEKYANIFAKEAKRRLDTELDKIKVPDNFSDKDLDVIF